MVKSILTSFLIGIVAQFALCQPKQFSQTLLEKLKSGEDPIVFKGEYTTGDLFQNGFPIANGLKEFLKKNGYNNLDGEGKVVIEPAISFDQASIDYLLLTDMHFKGQIAGQVKTLSTTVNNCIFEKAFSIYFMPAEDNHRSSDFNSCTFNGFEMYENNDGTNCSISKNTFNPPVGMHASRSFDVQGVYKLLAMSDNLFQDKKQNLKNVETNSINNVAVAELELARNKFVGNLKFEILTVTNRFISRDNQFDSLLLLNNVSFVQPYNDFIWDDFSGKKISVYDTDSTIINGQSTDFKNHFAFLELMRYYKHFFDTFKQNGDLQSSNNCYMELKDVEGARLRYKAETEGTFANYITWKLNRIVKFYSDHGTNPAKAIIISMYVLLGFAIIFFFYPSDWDVTSKSMLLANYKNFVEKNDKGYWKPFLILASGFLMSLVNAFTLSLNAFTTLGFGNIPTHGIARYLCILEGFLGWFLLSIFTVTLLNQVLS
jgi:hypothetical protein